MGAISPIGDFSGTPRNFLTRPSVPQIAVLQGAKVFLTHGGINSLMEAADLGVPVVVVPQMPEQKANALRVEALGMGLRLENRAVTPAALRSAVDKVLSDPAYARRSAAVGKMGRAAGGADAASRILSDYGLSASKR